MARPFRRHPRATAVTCGFAAAVLAVVVAANAYMVLSAHGRETADVRSVPRAQVAIVPGAFVMADGRMSTMLADRVTRAAALWRAGKVDRILVSGDHHRWSYDEPGTMRAALLRAGVPANVIFTDHAGFDTRATMIRARRVFGVRDAIVVTQGFHMARALYLAREAGLDAHGLTADLHRYGTQGRKSDVRELIARVKALADTATHAAVVLGAPVPIDGDGRASWGPAPPRGTPPAGAPR